MCFFLALVWPCQLFVRLLYRVSDVLDLSLVSKRFGFRPHITHVRDRPFNLKGGYGFLFHSEFFFRTTQEFEYLFFLSRKARNYFPEFNITLYDKNSESDFFFFLHQNQNIFFSNIGNQNIFLEKKS